MVPTVSTLTRRLREGLRPATPLFALVGDAYLPVSSACRVRLPDGVPAVVLTAERPEEPAMATEDPWFAPPVGLPLTAGDVAGSFDGVQLLISRDQVVAAATRVSAHGRRLLVSAARTPRWLLRSGLSGAGLRDRLAAVADPGRIVRALAAEGHAGIDPPLWRAANRTLSLSVRPVGAEGPATTAADLLDAIALRRPQVLRLLFADGREEPVLDARTDLGAPANWLWLIAPSFFRDGLPPIWPEGRCVQRSRPGRRWSGGARSRPAGGPESTSRRKRRSAGENG